MRLSLPTKILTNNYQTRVFTSGTGCRLQGTAFKTGDSQQLFAQLLNNLAIAIRLVGRSQRMNCQSATERNRNHCGSRIEFHRATAQRNHRCSKTDIFAVEALKVTHHFRF